MFPDSPYAVPTGSFLVPVPLPVNDPDHNPDVSVCFNSEWTPYIVGALKQLLLQATWDTTSTAQLDKVQGQVFNLIALFAAYSPCPKQSFKVYEEHINMVAFREDCNCNLFVECCDGTEKQIALAGNVPPGAQPGAGSPQPAPNGGHQQYCATMQAAGKLLIPTVVNAGDVISMISAVGAGNDGGTLGWFCPDGTDFFAGQCTGGGGTSGTDPLPTAKHMSLILNVAGTFYNIMAGSVTVPSGVSNAQAFIQVNDSVITDNSGSYQICVNVVNNQAGSWSHTFDFALSDGGWIVETGADGPGHWVSGSGWNSDPYSIHPSPPQNESLHIIRTVTAPAQINSASLSYVLPTSADNAWSFALKVWHGGVGATLVHQYDFPTPNAGTFVNQLITATAGTPYDTLEIVFYVDRQDASPGIAQKLVLAGIGVDPF